MLEVFDHEERKIAAMTQRFSKSIKAGSVLNAVARTALLISFGAVGAIIALAELPPAVYREQQAKAPESLIIKVRSVKTSQKDEPQLVRIAVIVEAQVEQVRRSQSGLKAGDVIQISYEHLRHKGPFVGPSQVPILSEGQECPAYLTKSRQEEKAYGPAAGGYSFKELK